MSIFGFQIEDDVVENIEPLRTVNEHEFDEQLDKTLN